MAAVAALLLTILLIALGAVCFKVATVTMFHLSGLLLLLPLLLPLLLLLYIRRVFGVRKMEFTVACAAALAGQLTLDVAPAHVSLMRCQQ